MANIRLRVPRGEGGTPAEGALLLEEEGDALVCAEEPLGGRGKEKGDEVWLTTKMNDFACAQCKTLNETRFHWMKNKYRGGTPDATTSSAPINHYHYVHCCCRCWSFKVSPR